MLDLQKTLRTLLSMSSTKIIPGVTIDPELSEIHSVQCLPHQVLVRLNALVDIKRLE